MGTSGLDWVPEACTLPTAERPLRVAEFDGLFASSVREVVRLEPTRLRLVLDPRVEATARELTARENECCSFFEFTFHGNGGPLLLDVGVPSSRVEVLDALAERASSAGAGGSVREFESRSVAGSGSCGGG